jgi:hypothetical protein
VEEKLQGPAKVDWGLETRVQKRLVLVGNLGFYSKCRREPLVCFVIFHFKRIIDL